MKEMVNIQDTCDVFDCVAISLLVDRNPKMHEALSNRLYEFHNSLLAILICIYIAS